MDAPKRYTENVGLPSPRLTSTIIDLLGMLSVSAIEVIVGNLCNDGIRAVRQTCAGLRDVVDPHIKSLRIQLGSRSAPPVPALGRWPKCSNLVFIWQDGQDHAVSWSRLLQTLAIQPLASRQRLRSLVLFSGFLPEGPYPENQPSVCGLACSALPLWLPKLRKLELRGWAHRGDLPEQQLFYAALATLPDLQQLVLSDFGSLVHIGALAGSLTSLEVHSDTANPPQLEHLELEGIFSLRKLRALKLYGSGCPLSVGLQLLNSLPPCLEILLFEIDPEADRGERVALHLQLQGGMLTECRFLLPEDDIAVSLSGVSNIIISVLLACRVLGPQLQLLELCDVLIKPGALLGDRAVQDLRGFVQRCGKVIPSTLHCRGDANLEAAMQAVDFMGTPQQVVLEMGHYDFTISHRPKRLDKQGLRAQLSRLTPHLQAALPSAVPPASSVLSLALQCMAGKAVDSALAERAADGANDCECMRPIIMCRGPAVRQLLQAPDMLHGWLQQLSERVRAAEGRLLYLFAQPLPQAGAVLLEWEEPLPEVFTAITAFAAETEGGVEVARLSFLCSEAEQCSGSVPWEVFTGFGKARQRLCYAAQWVLQHVWDSVAEEQEGPGVSSNTVGSETMRQRLEYLLAVMREFRQLPSARQLSGPS